MTLSETWADTHPDNEAEPEAQINAAAGQIEELAGFIRKSWRRADNCHQQGLLHSQGHHLSEWLTLMEEQNDVQAHMNRLALHLCRAKAEMLTKEAGIVK